MIFYFVLVASTLSFAQGEVHHDRKIFQPFDTENSTPAYQLISSTPQSQQKRREREILAEHESRNLSGGEFEILAVANQTSGTQLVTFDAGEEEWAEYEEDYQLLKEEYERNQWQEKKSNVTAEDARLDKDDCFWLFCSVSKKFVFIVMSIVALIIFWCYLGKICYFLPCGWANSSKVQMKIRNLLDKNRPGQMVNDQGEVVRYDPCEEEVEMFRELQQELQDL